MFNCPQIRDSHLFPTLYLLSFSFQPLDLSLLLSSSLKNCLLSGVFSPSAYYRASPGFQGDELLTSRPGCGIIRAKTTVLSVWTESKCWVLDLLCEKCKKIYTWLDVWQKVGAYIRDMFKMIELRDKKDDCDTESRESRAGGKRSCFAGWVSAWKWTFFKTYQKNSLRFWSGWRESGGSVW